MLKMPDKEESEDPSSTNEATKPMLENSKNGSLLGEQINNGGHSFIKRVRNFIQGKNDTTLREAIEEYIEEANNGHDLPSSVAAHERALISNILNLRDMNVLDVMVPRADIIAIEVNTSQKDLLSLLSEKQYSRIPVFRETLDDVLGTIHIKDILACLAVGKRIEIESLLRDAPIVSPSLPVLDLILMMRQLRKHMMLVVDEFGGIDGLITIGDVIESVIGEIEDEYEQNDQPQIQRNENGTLLADARVDLEEFEEKFGHFLEEEERDDDIDTLGGLVSSIAGRVPVRGEIISHPSGIIFEIIDADPRRVNRLLVKNISLLS